MPELIVTAHRLRTGVGNDWILNREAVEDRLLRAGYDLDLDATEMPADAWVDDNTLNGVALMSIPPNTNGSSRTVLALAGPRPDPQFPEFPAAHAFPREPHVARGNPPRRSARDPCRHQQLRADLAAGLPFRDPHLLPKGTVLHNVTWHDNTDNNKHNPDPSAWIGWGGRTMDEMGHGWTDIAFMTEEQYAQRRSERAQAHRDRTKSEE